METDKLTRILYEFSVQLSKVLKEESRKTENMSFRAPRKRTKLKLSEGLAKEIRKIVRDNKLSVTDLGKSIGISKQAVSERLSVHRAYYLKTVDGFQRAFHNLNLEGLESFDALAAGYRKFHNE